MKHTTEEEIQAKADKTYQVPMFNRNIYLEGLNEGFINGAEWLQSQPLYDSAPEMLEALKEAKSMIRSLKLSMMAHPDCEEGSEFDDYTSSAEEKENKIQSLIQKAKGL